MMVAGAVDKGSMYLIDIQKTETGPSAFGERKRIGAGPSRAPKFKPSFDRPAFG
jgi:hypothetical protein